MARLQNFSIVDTITVTKAFEKDLGRIKTMNLGTTILELRKQKNITQEDLAAELGVTAAAVSKWEHGYTLPDIMMLGALADYFEVTTDALLGRYPNAKYAVILAENLPLGEKIEVLAKENGFESCGIFTEKAQALAAAKKDARITYLIAGVYQTGFFDDSPLQKIASSHSTDEEILTGLQWAFDHCMKDK